MLFTNLKNSKYLRKTRQFTKSESRHFVTVKNVHSFLNKKLKIFEEQFDFMLCYTTPERKLLELPKNVIISHFSTNCKPHRVYKSHVRNM